MTNQDPRQPQSRIDILDILLVVGVLLLIIGTYGETLNLWITIKVAGTILTLIALVITIAGSISRRD